MVEPNNTRSTAPNRHQAAAGKGAQRESGRVVAWGVERCTSRAEERRGKIGQKASEEEIPRRPGAQHETVGGPLELRQCRIRTEGANRPQCTGTEVLSRSHNCARRRSRAYHRTHGPCHSRVRPFIAAAGTDRRPSPRRRGSRGYERTNFKPGAGMMVAVAGEKRRT